MKPVRSPFLTDELAKLDSEGSLSLLIRHARREHIREATMESAFDAALTPAGHEQAKAFGAALPPARPASIHFSPVPRCKDTALRIAEGFESSGGEATVAGPRRLLGATFVKDERRVIATFASLGLRGFIEAWYRGELPRSIVEDPRLAGEELLEGLAPRSDGDSGSSLEINVSHDVVIVALLGLAWSVDATDFPWPGFLDGVILSSPPQGALLRYHGEHRPLAIRRERRGSDRDDRRQGR